MSNLNLKQGKVAAESGDGGGGEPLGLMRGLRSRMAPLLFLITVLSSCSAVGYKPHHVDNTLRTLRTRALAQLGVEDEGVQVSSEYVDYALKPLRLAVGCEGGDKGFVRELAKLKALAVAKAAGFEEEIDPIVVSETSVFEYEVV